MPKVVCEGSYFSVAFCATGQERESRNRRDLKIVMTSQKMKDALNDIFSGDDGPITEELVGSARSCNGPIISTSLACDTGVIQQ